MEECSYCQHDILSGEDFGSILNHELHCPARRGADRVSMEKYDAGYMDRLGDRQTTEENPAYILGWQ